MTEFKDSIYSKHITSVFFFPQGNMPMTTEGCSNDRPSTPTKRLPSIGGKRHNLLLAASGFELTSIQMLFYSQYIYHRNHVYFRNKKKKIESFKHLLNSFIIAFNEFICNITKFLLFCT